MSKPFKGYIIWPIKRSAQNVTQLGEGFTFGGRPPPASSSPARTEGSLANRRKRRGDHHKHSTTPTMEPASPWNPTPTPSTGGMPPSISDHLQNGVAILNPSHHDHPEPSSVPGAISVVQFLLGASLWVSGQQSGLLTGLEFGSNARIETLMLFSQSVYLIFSSVYVCKETVEQLLLSAGEGHHHHRGEDLDTTGTIPFPTFLILITLISLISTSLFYNNHTKLFEGPSQHRPFEPLLAAVETVLTFSIAYPASVILGTVLLQTSPERGLPGGRMEAPLVVTLELHVRSDMDDTDVLELTRWAHDRCRIALSVGSKWRGEDDGTEISVGIVKG
ncbi:hypothetical protein BD410DRAFT_813569 [Rickenella mellea]|uniref:Uncharacterized protein n=1 Tax=Rickenella mellea TaxID=50990 RepID=A0A4Y7QE95_9AGAM|nr:hypothetical protein BD410DRAFT_813569 [Rickenella mellea]